MLNFQSTNFFVKFTLLFFILIIFGYWGVDLNSEELYIAFSFFILVLFGVTLFKSSLVLIFTKMLNVKYFRLFIDLLSISGAVWYKLQTLVFLREQLKFVEYFIATFITFNLKFFIKNDSTVYWVITSNAYLLSVILPLSFRTYLFKLELFKKFQFFNSFVSRSFAIQTN